MSLPGSGSENRIKTYRVWCLLRAAIVAFALSWCSAAVADETRGDSSESAAGGGIEASGSSSEKAKPASFWSHLDLNVYGLAYHPDRETVHKENLDNEVNPGLGLHYELRNTKRGVTFAEAGAYYDSGSEWAKFVGLGYQFKIADHWRIGGALAAVHSRTYNDGVAFIAMIPLLTYDFGRVKLNAVYYPKIPRYNEVAAFGVYVSIPLGQWLR